MLVNLFLQSAMSQLLCSLIILFLTTTFAFLLKFWVSFAGDDESLYDLMFLLERKQKQVKTNTDQLVSQTKNHWFMSAVKILHEFLRD